MVGLLGWATPQELKTRQVVNMCTVSYVSPQRSGDSPWTPGPYEVWPGILPKPAIKRVMDYTVQGPFSEWSIKQCLAYVELLEKAQAFDKVNEEPHCSDPEKTKHLKSLRSRITEIGLSQPINADDALKLVARLDKIIANL